MKSVCFFLLALLTSLLLPTFVHAQIDQGVGQLHLVLDSVRKDMIPLCAELLKMCQAIAGSGVTFYIGVRVWKHIARAEPIDFVPLLRPFFIVLLIGFFPIIITVMDKILEPSVTATAAMVKHENDAVNTLLVAQAAEIGGDTSSVILSETQGMQDGWQKYSQPNSTTSGEGGGIWSAIGSGFKFLASGIMNAWRFLFRFFLSIILEVVYFAASLCIDSIRTFHLIVLGILGPFAFAFSCYDGFSQSLVHWLGRYINIYLWLPIANILGAILGRIQVKMLQIDLAGMHDGTLSFFSPTDIAYLIFLVVGIICYTTVPSLANYIIQVHGPSPLLHKVTQMASSAFSSAVGGSSSGSNSSATGASGGSSDRFLSENSSFTSGSPANQYNRDKLNG